MKKINDAALQCVNGGYIFNANGSKDSDLNTPWEVINDSDGVVKARFESIFDALDYAGDFNLSDRVVDIDFLTELRECPGALPY